MKGKEKTHLVPVGLTNQDQRVCPPRWFLIPFARPGTKEPHPLSPYLAVSVRKPGQHEFPNQDKSRVLMGVTIIIKIIN